MTDQFGRSAAMWATENGKKSLLQLLITAGASVEQMDQVDAFFLLGVGRVECFMR